MASIRDVAQKAGVGVGTVSRVINGSGYVAEDTRKKSWQKSFFIRELSVVEQVFYFLS